MGGKGGGGGDFYAAPPDTSGYGTPEEAAATLAASKPIDMSKFQQTIDVQKAAKDASAPAAAPPAADTGTTDNSTGSTLADAVLAPPNYWTNKGLEPAALNKSKAVTTN